MQVKPSAFLWGVLSILSWSAQAADAPADKAASAEKAPPTIAATDPGRDELWIVTFQGIGAFAPSYPGSKRLQSYPFPGFTARPAKEPERFSTPDEGFGFPLFDQQGFRFGPVGNFVFVRGAAPGLRHVALTHEVGGFLEYSMGDHFRARTELRQGIDGHQGFVATLGADVYGGSDAVTLSVGPRLNFGDNRYANAYFSVTPVDLLATGRGLPVYQATGGFTSAGGIATMRYVFNPQWNATLFGGMQRLTGSVGASPIPNLIGSRDQFTAGLAISRSFEVHKFW
jgi:outer membrane protein